MALCYTFRTAIYCARMWLTEFDVVRVKLIAIDGFDALSLVACTLLNSFYCGIRRVMV